MCKSRALFDLTEERNKVHPRGVDYQEHQEVLQELAAARLRLKQKAST